jgi:rhodanese-related sulfurtransferase
MKYNWKRALVLLPAAVLMFSLSACEDDATEPSLTDFEVVRQAIATWLGGSPAPAIAPSTVYDDVTGDQNYYILSVRAESAYDIGHIAGAARMNWNECYTSANTATLPTDQTVVVYCYTGHSGGIAAATLGIMGFDTENLKWGMMNWSDDPDVVGVSIWDAEDTLGGTLETLANSLGTTEFDYPDIEVSTSDDVATIVRAAAERWLSGAAGSDMFISASALQEELSDGDTSDDPIIISVRSASDYSTLGHVPGAINIARDDLTNLDTLNKLDPDKDIVVYCYTGHSAGQATVILNMLGYNAKNMLFGMMGWNTAGNGDNASFLFSGAPGYTTATTGGN